LSDLSSIAAEASVAENGYMTFFTKPRGASQAFMMAGAAWFVFGALYGIISAISLVAPEFFSNIPWLVFGRTRPIHVNTVIYGFVTSTLIGCGLHYVPSLLRTRLWSEPLAWFGFLFCQLTVLSGPLTFSVGVSQGREYAEYVWITVPETRRHRRSEHSDRTERRGASMKPAVKLGIALGALVVLAGLAIVSVMGYVLITGPRMRMQPNVRPFQAEVPPLPTGVVPVDLPDASSSGRVPAEEDAAKMVNPLPATEENAARGKVYYQYYCVFCHGEKGDGNGPVGQSYTPKPADLRAPKVQAYSDGQMLRSMLTGEGHEPVLEKVVPMEHRWYLVYYVRILGSSTPR